MKNSELLAQALSYKDDAPTEHCHIQAQARQSFAEDFVCCKDCKKQYVNPEAPLPTLENCGVLAAGYRAANTVECMDDFKARFFCADGERA